MSRTPAGYELYASALTRSYNTTREAEALFGGLGRDGLHVEVKHWGIYVLNTYCDFRFLAIDGKVTHAIGRSGDLPVTHRYLGGRNREIDAYVEHNGEDQWRVMVDVAERAAACFPSSHRLGINVLPNRGPMQVVPDLLVTRIDPFGDYLPGLLTNGVDTWTAQLRSLATTTS